jgi:WD40 repeat protein
MFNSVFTKILVTALLLGFVWKFQVIDLLIFPSSIKNWQLPLESWTMAVSPDGQMLATTSGEFIRRRIPNNYHAQGHSLVEIRRVSNGSIIKNLDFFAASSLAFSHDNSLLAAGGYNGEVKIWRTSNGELLYSLNGLDRFKKSGTETNIPSFTPDGKHLVTLTNEPTLSEDLSNQLTVWNLNNGEKNYSLSGQFISAAISPDGQTIALSNLKEPIALYRLSDGTLIKQLEKTSKRIFNLRFSQDGKLLAGIHNGGDQGILVYRVEDGQLLRTFSSRIQAFLKKESLVNFTLSPDSKHLAASYDVNMSQGFIFDGAGSYPLTSHGRIRVWELDTGKQIQTLRGHKRGTNVLAFTPDGKMLASAGKDGTIRFWKFPPQYPLLVWLIMISGIAAVVRYWRR